MKQISLSGKNGKGKIVIVDDEDFKALNKHKWYLDPHGYAVRREYIKGSGRKNQKCVTIRMHRLINNTPKDKITDHINRNRLDNRKENLRTADFSLNSQNVGISKRNKSGYKGISWYKRDQSWEVRKMIDLKYHYLGRFKELSDAIKTYNDFTGIAI